MTSITLVNQIISVLVVALSVLVLLAGIVILFQRYQRSRQKGLMQAGIGFVLILVQLLGGSLASVVTPLALREMNLSFMEVYPIVSSIFTLLFGIVGTAGYILIAVGVWQVGKARFASQ